MACMRGGGARAFFSTPGGAGAARPGRGSFRAQGRREILSIDVGEAETDAFWTSFLRGLVKRGLVGVQLAISDAHAGLKAAIAKVLGCAWQRCTVHFLRDCLGHA